MVDIVKLIISHANENGKELIPSGARLKCTCFFHDEKDPSFVVYPETNTWWCFGCGEGRTPEDFIIRYYGKSLAPGIIMSWGGGKGDTDELDDVVEGLQDSYEQEKAVTIATRISIYLRDSSISPSLKSKLFAWVDELVRNNKVEKLMKLELKVVNYPTE